jgi:hypothetical protein
VKSLAPFLAAVALAQWGSGAALWTLAALSAASVVLAISLGRVAASARRDAI